jgi:transposase-like protein
MKSLSCPNRHCPPTGKGEIGAIIRRGFYTTRSGKRRCYQCQTCGKAFCSTTRTPYHRLQHRRATFDKVAALSVEGLNKSAIARVQRIAWNTVHCWLEKVSFAISSGNAGTMFLSDTMSQRLAILFGFLPFALAPAQHSDDSFEAQHKQALAANPSNLHLKISLDSGQTAFHIGDTIRLNFEFTVDSPGKYVAGARYLDRSERSVLESFITDRPADARDPLHDFWEFHSALFGSHLSAPRNPCPARKLIS